MQPPSHPLLPRYERFFDEQGRRRAFQLLDLVDAGETPEGYPTRVDVEHMALSLDARGVEIVAPHDPPSLVLPKDHGETLERYADRLETTYAGLPQAQERRYAFAYEIASTHLQQLVYATPRGRRMAIEAILDARDNPTRRGFVFHDAEGVDWSSPKADVELDALATALHASVDTENALREQHAAASPERRPTIVEALRAHFESDARLLIGAHLDPTPLDRYLHDRAVYDLRSKGSWNEPLPPGSALDDVLRRVVSHPHLLYKRGSLSNRALFWFVVPSFRHLATVLRETRSSPLPPRELSDAIKEGFIRAARKYSPRRGYRFATYALHWGRHAAKRAGADLAETEQR